jgi:tetratricopeptide (TPR) repeat protein
MTQTAEKGLRKQALLALLDQARAMVEAWAQALTDEERAAAGSFARWSATETLAHIAHWHGQLALALDLWARHETVPALWADEDEENRRLFEQQRGMAWSQAGAEARQAYEALRAQVESLDVTALEAVDDFAWREGKPLWRTIAGNGYRHPGVHLAGYWSQRGDFDRMITILAEMAAATGRIDPASEQYGADLYNLACAYAEEGRSEAALGYLRQALVLAPDLAAWAREDADLNSLHGLAAYEALVGPPPA